MSAIILKNSKQTIKQSFVELSHKNEGKNKISSITSLVTKIYPKYNFCSLKYYTKNILVHSRKRIKIAYKIQYSLAFIVSFQRQNCSSVV